MSSQIRRQLLPRPHMVLNWAIRLHASVAGAHSASATRRAESIFSSVSSVKCQVYNLCIPVHVDLLVKRFTYVHVHYTVSKYMLNALLSGKSTGCDLLLTRHTHMRSAENLWYSLCLYVASTFNSRCTAAGRNRAVQGSCRVLPVRR